MVVTLQISNFICCQLIDPCFQAIYFIVLPQAVRKTKATQRAKERQSDNVKSMLKRGPVFQSKSSEENDSSCFRFLQNFEMLGVLEVYDSYNGKKDRLFSKEPLFPYDCVS